MDRIDITEKSTEEIRQILGDYGIVETPTFYSDLVEMTSSPQNFVSVGEDENGETVYISGVVWNEMKTGEPYAFNIDGNRFGGSVVVTDGETNRSYIVIEE